VPTLKQARAPFPAIWGDLSIGYNASIGKSFQTAHGVGSNHPLRRRRDAPVAAVAGDRAETFPDLA
jgi:hypothetical protein